MSFFLVKALLAVVFLAAGLTSALSMLSLLGRTERKMSAEVLKRTHHVAGYIFALLLVVLAVMGTRFLAAAGDGLSLRGVLHWTLASLLVFLVILKLSIVRFYKKLLKHVPVMGMMIVVLALLVAALSLGAFVVTGGRMRSIESEHRARDVATDLDGERSSMQTPEEGPLRSTGDGERGAGLFGAYCAGCHNADSDETKVGPGLAGLFGRDELPMSGQPVTSEAVRAQILSPVGTMPSFAGYISDEELNDLVAYLGLL